jgi:hypothetical protein
MNACIANASGSEKKLHNFFFGDIVKGLQRRRPFYNLTFCYLKSMLCRKADKRCYFFHE